MVISMRAATTMTPTLVAMALVARAVSNKTTHSQLVQFVEKSDGLYRLENSTYCRACLWRVGSGCVQEAEANFCEFNIKTDNPHGVAPVFEEK